MTKSRSTSSNKVSSRSPPTERPIAADGITDSSSSSSAHLVVGIGASAGGLDAFRAFFSEMPVDSGMAYVLVQHLDPDYNSALAEIISECTEMPVVKAVDGTVAAPNTVAVIPQNAILRIEGGVLRVAMPETPTARRSSIDTFLVSLAEDQGANAVGIILSGYGSDGTIGIEAVKEAGGLTLSEAAFDHRAKFGMPQSATVGGFVDYVLQPHEMPARLLEYRDFKSREPDYEDPLNVEPDLAKSLVTITAVLNSRLGRDFGQYKSSTLSRRVRRRMQVLHIDDPRDYIEQLRKLPSEPELLFREILIGVTRFFRDPAMFETLAKTVVPEIVAAGGPDEPIRIWVAGCARGEEAYSLAILFKEALTKAESPRRITIFATDIDDLAITVARTGLYSADIEADLTSERLTQHFIKEGQRYRIAKHIRDMCVFSTHDLVKDPPFSKLDMVTCRNLLIYFEAPLQKRVISTFHYGIKAGGFLWLGPSETIAASGRLFLTFDKRSRIFRRLDVVPEIPRTTSGRRAGAVTPVQRNVGADSLDAQANRMVAQYAPAYIVFDSQHEIQRFSGPVAKFMEPMSGGASLNVFRMLHAQLRPPVRNLIRKALEGQGPVQETVTFRVSDQSHTINLIAQPLTETAADQISILLVFQELFTDATVSFLKSPDDDTPSVDLAHGELIATREKLQTITEELETANEELQSSNEEFQSVNEELHSTVEELETSKEELQSINEELQTVNAELNNRADSLVRSNSDLANLFDSTSIATLFLDNGSHIRRFTPAITEIFDIREGDEGRLISNFSSRLAGSALTRDIATVLRDLGSLERETDSEDGEATYLVRVKPYRDLNNVIDGVVITLIDISERKKLERDHAHLAAIVTSSEDAIISHDLEGMITSWNAGAEKIYGYTAIEMIGQPMATLLDEAQFDEWPGNLARLRRGEPVTDIDISRVTKGDRVIYVSLTISPMRDAKGSIIGASAVARDIAQRKLSEERTLMLMAELDHRVKNIIAVVASVVNQSLKGAGTADAARAEIEGRIQAISRAHNLLKENGGLGGSLRDLVETELSPYEQKSNVSKSGDDVVLSSRANLNIGLAIHELATNSAKYGALSTDAGHLDVTWQVKGISGEQTLEISWLETAGPPVVEPLRRGFGTKLIEQSLMRGLKAKVIREFPEDGVRCHISIPFTQNIGRIRSEAGPDRAS
ncbi:PAS domain S-box protein [Altererythrobacter sp. KTW20L]|uniref:CheR family methyltransferase n=1 Tax=Altererythrobacter sp. KTW20L TaxID=2942210 RepID=UPI0020BDFB8B|nr:CheR family methyltransferase [Altererythrobacter sp. KTW20L]MCL6250836.1 PAS domain S-box protein [Altererythrobacter sp. KTW20L]